MRRCALPILVAVISACAAVCAAGTTTTATRPNLVFILVDDLRWDALGYAGHPFVKTPNIDRIAAEGANLRNAFVSIPLCSPSRASFLTGQYAHAHGVVDNRERGNDSQASGGHALATFARYLQPAGYETAYIGKWHMGNDSSPRPGFDHWVGFKGQGSYANPVLNIDGTESRAEGYMTDILTSHAVGFIRRPRAKPFLLCLGHKAVHGPFTPAERHRDLYATATIARRRNTSDSLEGKPAIAAMRTPGTAAKPGRDGKRKPAGSGDELARNQLRCMASVDEGVGLVLDALRDVGQLDNTFVVFTSDNGYFWREHGMGDKRLAYEESIRIPMTIRYPKLIEPGTAIGQMALNIDIAPTFLDLAGVPIPGDMHGRSLLPLFTGRPVRWRASIMTEYFREQRYPHPTWQAIRTDRLKYIHYPEIEGADELYDLTSDPYELRNLAGSAESQAILEPLREELYTILRQTGARQPDSGADSAR